MLRVARAGRAAAARRRGAASKRRDDAAADRDALAGGERPDLGAVRVAVGDELQPPVRAGRHRGRTAGSSSVEAGDDDLEVVGLERLAGVDDVEDRLPLASRASGSV